MKIIFIIAILTLVALAEEGNHCPCCNKWTRFYNRDRPDGLGELELLVLHRKENPGQICAAPEAADCRPLTGRRVVKDCTTSLITIADCRFRRVVPDCTTSGITCFNFLQPDGKCEDYKVRYCCSYRYPSCPRGYRWTRYYNRDTPTGTGDYETLSLINKENPYARVCTDPIAIDVRVTRTGRDYSTAGEVVCLVPQLGFSCVDAQQSDGQCQDYKIRFCCPNNY